MILYAANYSDSIISPPVVITLGTVAFFFSAMEIILDYCIGWVRGFRDTIKEADALTPGMAKFKRFLILVAEV